MDVFLCQQRTDSGMPVLHTTKGGGGHRAAVEPLDTDEARNAIRSNAVSLGPLHPHCCQRENLPHFLMAKDPRELAPANWTLLLLASAGDHICNSLGRSLKAGCLLCSTTGVSHLPPANVEVSGIEGGPTHADQGGQVSSPGCTWRQELEDNKCQS